jgi:Na+-translocating ferredoxin:NAD+ oxidoreductase RnfC subunit
MTVQPRNPGIPDLTPCPACNVSNAAQAEGLAGLLRDDDVDAAIEAGLMAFAACAECVRHGGHADAFARIAAAQQRLRDAWAARDRHRARTARLQRRAAERAARRAIPAQADARKPALPPAAAAALARAKARAAGKP